MFRPLIFVYVLIIFGLSFLKNTYVVNLFNPDHDLLIGRYYSPEIYQLGQPLMDYNDITTNPRGSSVLLYHLMFALTNSLFLFLLFRKMEFQKIHWMVFIGLSLVVAILYVIYVVSGWGPCYTLSLLLKDFLQSALYPFLFLILATNKKLFFGKKQIPAQ